MILSIFFKLVLLINLLQISALGLSIFFDEYVDEAKRNKEYDKLFVEWQKKEEERNKNK
jgi:hypothetical protein